MYYILFYSIIYMGILSKIDSSYKRKHKKVNKILNIRNNYVIKFDKNDSDLLHLYNNDNKKYMTAKFAFYGIITMNSKFTWANMIQGVNNTNIINKINEIRDNTVLFKDATNYRMKFYHKLLTQDKITINGDKELEWINKLLTYLNDDFYFLNAPNSHNNIQIFGLHKIKEKYF